MTTQSGSSHYRRGLELAEAGKYQEGLSCIREHLRTTPHDAQALNDAGAILHCLGRTDDAISYLDRARALMAGSGEIVWNLVEAYLAGGRAAEAAALFDDMERLGIISIDVLNRTATMLLDQGRKGQAIEVLLRSRRLWPEQEVLGPILDVVRSKRPKVAFWRNGAGEDGAPADICDFVQQRFRTEFHEGGGPGEMAELLRRSDIAWIDGGGEMAVQASRPGGHARVVVSVRCADVRERWARDVPWENVEILVEMGGAAVEEMLLRQVPDLRNRTRLVLVPHGVDLDRYLLRRRTRGKNLVCLGGLTMEANPAFLLQCLQKLHYLDPTYRLFCTGAFESPTLEQYVRYTVGTLGLAEVVSFEPCPGDLNGWLSDKHYIVAGGIGEGRVEALLAGMACGLKPVVHNFPGADRLLPSAYLFNIAEQFCEQVRAGGYEPESYRRFVAERYPLAEQLRRVNGILTQLETEIELPAGAELSYETPAPFVGLTACGNPSVRPAPRGAGRL